MTTATMSGVLDADVTLRPRWPSTRGRRWLLRLALGVPFVILALVADARGIVSLSNEQLEVAGKTIDWGDDRFDFLGNVYPPIPTAVAALLPGGALWSGLVGALAAGVVLQVLAERLRIRDVAPLALTLLVASVGATPAFAYLSTQDLAGFLGMALFALALAGLLRFAVDGDTEGGFQCGLALGVAAMCDPATVVYATFFATAAPLVAWRRYRGQPGAISATFAVVVFPAAAAMLGWAFLEWQFTGEIFASVRAQDDFLAFPDGVFGTLLLEFVDVIRRVAITPVFVITAILIARRRPIALGGPLMALLSLTVAQWLGFNLGTGQTLVIIASIGVMTVPERPSRNVTILLACASVVQIALSWIPWRPSLPVTQFVEQLFA
ncbi:hypothetical protein [Ilumatobacter nonamiensis]|uniref:hypothetical protein n=1 Tax=Ilumatobacter nonamiensis TaxID=467093 RepID=UPI000344C952|nr:hypothetical protein [Ilumatobacter nonamiensis]